MSSKQSSLEREIQTYFQIMQSMDALYEEYARKNGLTYMSLYVLETIYEQKGCTQKRISEITLYPKQTVNMVIRSFLEKGWVVLEQIEDDRRNKQVMLTEAGQQFARQVIDPYWDAGSCAISEMKAEERRIMIQALEAFEQAFAKKVKQL